MNPYASTVSTATPAGASRRVSVATYIGLVFGGFFLAGVLYLSAYILYLYIRYPGLTDPSARPVDYWPEIDVLVSSIAIGFGFVIGLPVFIASLVSFRRSEKDCDTMIDPTARQNGLCSDEDVP